MTIVMIGQKGLPARSGGIERHVELLASGLALRGQRVVVFGRRWYVGDAQAPAGVEQIFTSGIKTKHLDAITHSFTALLAAMPLRPDVVHLHGTGIALLTPVARLLFPRAKVVVTFHCLDRRLAKWGWLAKAAFRVGEWLACHCAHQTLTVSQSLARYCLENYGCQVTYVPQLFEAPQCLAAPAPRAFGLEPDKYLLFVGRLIPDKCAHVLVQAYKQASQIKPELFKNLPLVIVGGSAHSDRYVEDLTRQAGQVPGVVMLGEQSGNALRGLQAHALVHVFPTASEGLSLAILEAAVSAKPIIASDLPENREATGGLAWEVAANDPAALAEKLIEVAALPPTERARVGAAVQSHVQKTFVTSLAIDDILNSYQTLLNPCLAVRGESKACS